MQLTFFTHGLCPYAQRVGLAIHWKGLPHDVVEIDLSSKPSWMRSRLGTTLVPAVEIDGAPYSESLDICWMLEKYPSADGCPPLVPNDPALRSDLERLVSLAPELERAGWGLLGGAWSFSSGPASKGAVQKWMAAVATLTSSIAAHEGPFLLGASPTLADCALAPFIARFELAASRCRSYDCRANAPALAAYLEALEATEAWAATFPDRKLFGDAIAKFTSLDYFDYRTASLRNPLPKS
jgi:glutathione S-transferase